MDFYIAMFDDPAIVKSCLAGTTVQEVADSNGPLRDAANVCFVNAIDSLQLAPRPAVTISDTDRITFNSAGSAVRAMMGDRLRRG
jgi:hypothetical protein